MQVFQEVVSYIKGAAEGISSDGGQLTLSQYLEVRWTVSSTLWCLSRMPLNCVGAIGSHKFAMFCTSLQVGRKRAPNFSSDMRRRVYPVFLKYETLKVTSMQLDRITHVTHDERILPALCCAADVVGHLTCAGEAAAL